MGHLMVLLFIGVRILLMPLISCHENNQHVLNKIQDLNEEIVDVRSDILLMDERIMSSIDSTKRSLTSEQTNLIVQQVVGTMTEILKNSEFEQILNSHLVSEVRKLKHGHRQMKRQLRRIVKSMKNTDEERKSYKQELLKAERKTNEMAMCSKYIIDSEVLNLMNLRQTVNENDKHISGDEHSSINTVSSSFLESQSGSFERESSPRLASGITTPVTQIDMSTATQSNMSKDTPRILIVPWSFTRHQIWQLNIQNDTFGHNRDHKFVGITSVAYLFKTNKLLMGLSSPDKIVSTNLDNHSNNYLDGKTLQEDVRSYGMTVDEKKEYVFLTIYMPGYSVGCMTTEGDNFTIIRNMTSSRDWSKAISVDPKREKLFVSRGEEVLIMSYGGDIIHVVQTDINSFALVFDAINNALYYSKHNHIMKLSLTQNVTTLISTVSVIPWNLIYYKNTLYFSSYSVGDVNYGFVGVINMGQNMATVDVQQNDTGTEKVKDILPYRLQSIGVKDVNGLHMCLAS